jgi:hypothetical protein
MLAERDDWPLHGVSRLLPTWQLPGHEAIKRWHWFVCGPVTLYGMPRGSQGFGSLAQYGV